MSACGPRMHKHDVCVGQSCAFDLFEWDVFSVPRHWGAGAGMAGELVAALKSVCDHPEFLLQAVAMHAILKPQCTWQVTEESKLSVAT